MEHSWKDRKELNKNEQIKLQKDGLAIFQDLEKFRKLSMTEMLPEDIELLKWAGVYAQRPKNGHFMLRIKIPSGKLTSSQAREIALLAKKYGHGEIQITTRQAMQLHWLELKDLPDILERLQKIGLTTTEACGDCPRNILGNPLMGIDPDELLDTTTIVEELMAFFINNPEFSNLPRKFKISVSSNPHDTGYAAINDLAFIPAMLTANEVNISGFHVLVGGGLSAQPHLAKKLDIFLTPKEVLPFARAIALIFREQGYRVKRTHCRLKFLIEDWSFEKIYQEIEKITGPLTHGGQTQAKDWNPGIYHGVHPQKQGGYSYIGADIPMGQLRDEDLLAFADLAETYGDGNLRTTNSQNILLINIPNEKVPQVSASPLLQKFSIEPKYFSGYATACTGNTYCNWAPIETQQRLLSITQTLDKEFPKINSPIRLHLSGCPHSCAQTQIADIGLCGGLERIGDISVASFTVFIGGTLGSTPAFAKQLKGRIKENDVLDFLRKIIELFITNHKPSESFHQFSQRIGIAVFQQIFDDCR